jgi:glycerophosphoryl diester phosphodiesterase
MTEPIQILAHRGLWGSKDEQNSFAALARALDEGFGVETDVRDHHEDLVISHDPPSGQSWPLLSLLEYYASCRSQCWLALNIKADGLARLLQQQLAQFAIQHYFVFDMSVPDLRSYQRLQLTYFTRHSDLEPDPALYDKAAGVWLDAFDGEWYGSATIDGHLHLGKHVAVVSPELHGRPVAAVWQMLWHLDDQRDWAGRPQLMVCTDRPREFRQRKGI